MRSRGSQVSWSVNGDQLDMYPYVSRRQTVAWSLVDTRKNVEKEARRDVHQLNRWFVRNEDAKNLARLALFNLHGVKTAGQLTVRAVVLSRICLVELELMNYSENIKYLECILQPESTCTKSLKKLRFSIDASKSHPFHFRHQVLKDAHSLEQLSVRLSCLNGKVVKELMYLTQSMTSLSRLDLGLLYEKRDKLANHPCIKFCLESPGILASTTLHLAVHHEQHWRADGFAEL